MREKIGEWRDRAEGRKQVALRQDVTDREKKRVAERTPPRIEPSMAPIEQSARAEKERQVPLFEPPSAGELPPLSLLDDPAPQDSGYSEESLEAMSRLVELKLRDFGIEVEVVSVSPGPIITRFELDPAPGVKVSQIVNLAKDLARSLSVVSVRVVEVIPGKSFIGLEIPNENRELVTLGEILKSKAYDDLASPLTLALGKDISGQSVVADLSRMPHLLIAGTTGSGKSVAINAMVLSLLYKAKPDHVRLIMVDPKMLELSVYEGIPHLLTPVVTDMKEAANALRWCVGEMDRRYRLMAALGVRNIGGYNRKVKDAIEAGSPIPDPTWSPPEIEDPEKPVEQPTLIRVAVHRRHHRRTRRHDDDRRQEGRRTHRATGAEGAGLGIHMLLATQRPSVDVITGLIKANIPSRIAFQVSAKVDSRTILDQMGAENLLGHGDMLLPAAGYVVADPGTRCFRGRSRGPCRGAQSSRKPGLPRYIDEIVEAPQSPTPGLTGLEVLPGDDTDAEQDPLYDQAVQVVMDTTQGIDFGGAAAPEDWLQPGGSHGRVDGAGRPRGSACSRMVRARFSCRRRRKTECNGDRKTGLTAHSPGCFACGAIVCPGGTVLVLADEVSGRAAGHRSHS